MVVGMVGFCGSRTLPASAEISALISGVVGSVLAASPCRGVAVGCAKAPTPSSSPRRSPWALPPGYASSPPSAPSPRLARLPRVCSRRVFLRLLGLRRGSASPPARPSRGRPVAVPRSPWRSGSPPARLPSSRRSPPPVRGAASSGSSPRLPSRPRSLSFSLGVLLRARVRSWASLALASGLGFPSSSSPSGLCLCRRWALRACSPPRGARGSRWRRLDGPHLVGRFRLAPASPELFGH